MPLATSNGRARSPVSLLQANEPVMGALSFYLGYQVDFLVIAPLLYKQGSKCRDGANCRDGGVWWYEHMRSEIPFRGHEPDMIHRPGKTLLHRHHEPVCRHVRRWDHFPYRRHDRPRPLLQTRFALLALSPPSSPKTFQRPTCPRPLALHPPSPSTFLTVPSSGAVPSADRKSVV